jgi:3-dehydroquinate synthase
VTPGRGQGADRPLILRGGALDEIGRRLLPHHITSAVVVTNEVVGPLYVDRVNASLGRAELIHDIVTLPDGEPHKTLETVRYLYEIFIDAGLDRDGVVIALGGGVIGDLAGFAAATYLRGVRLVQMPTSLLAMLDASIGGKVAVNLPRGKNLVGAFWPPLFVLADSDVLATLPERELGNGLAEMVKAAIVGDVELFEELERGNRPYTAERLLRAAAVKRRLVAEDPFEDGRRVALNLGHTFAHALEVVSGYTLPHGQAVAIGLVAAARLAARLQLCAAELPERIAALLQELGLTIECPLDPQALLAAMGTDKKRRGGQLRFVLPRALGTVVVVERVPPAAVQAALRSPR